MLNVGDLRHMITCLQTDCTCWIFTLLQPTLSTLAILPLGRSSASSFLLGMDWGTALMVTQVDGTAGAKTGRPDQVADVFLISQKKTTGALFILDENNLFVTNLLPNNQENLR